MRSLAFAATWHFAHDGPAPTFGLMQAAGEYADHIRVVCSWETRLGRTLLRPDAVKARAACLVREIATTDVNQRDLIGV